MNRSEKNLAAFLGGGEYPPLTYDLPAPIIIAKDPDADMVLLAGLGVFGLGQMWVRATEKHKNSDGYQTAPIETCEAV